MLRTIGLVGNIELPTSTAKAKAVCELFEKDQVRFFELAGAQAGKYISGADAIAEVVEVARKHWYAACRRNALAKPVSDKRASKKLS